MRHNKPGTNAELFAGRSVDIQGIVQRLKRVAKELGLPLADRTKTYNSRLAQELAKWAEAEGKGDEFHNRRRESSTPVSFLLLCLPSLYGRD